MLQAATEPTSLNPDHRVGQGVKAGITVEDVNRNGVGFDPVGVPGKRFLHDVLQKALLPVGGAKFLAADDALERVMNEMGRNRFVGIV